MKSSSPAAKAKDQAQVRSQQGQPAVLPPFTLWYNGDWNQDGNTVYGNGIGFNEDDYCNWGNSGLNAHVYDDFIVSSPNGWQVTGVFSDNYQDLCDGLGDQGAIWEIRQNMSPGDGGQIVASGYTYTPEVTYVGPPDYSIERVMVTGLDLHLPPGQYWLNVTPTGPGAGSAEVRTSGLNCVGSPCGNDNNSYAWAPEYGDFWAQLIADYEMGVVGYSCPGNCEIYVSTAKSVKIMLSGLELDVPLDLTGESAVEDRSGGPGGNYTVAMTFSQSIISVAHASVSCGRVASTSINGSVLTVNLTGVGNTCNASDITLAVNDVKDDAGDNLGSVCVTMGMLLGDVDGNRVVDSNDSAIVRSQLGQPTNSTNLRSDVNNDGTISSADVQIISRHLGTRLP